MNMEQKKVLNLPHH